MKAERTSKLPTRPLSIGACLGRPYLSAALPMIPSLQHWGPFADGLRPSERLARLRALRAIVRLLTGPRGTVLEAELSRAETGEVALCDALAGLHALVPLDRRRVLASYAALSRPAVGAGRF